MVARTMTAFYPKLQSARLGLHPLVAEDEPLYCRIYTDVDMMRHVAEPLSEESARRSFRSALAAVTASPPRMLLWKAVLLDDASTVGLIGLVPHAGRRAADIGAMIERPWQGRGLAGEALASVRDHAFAEGGFARLEGRQDAGNLRSIRLMERLGFTRHPLPEGRIAWRLGRRHWQAGMKLPNAFAMAAGPA